MSIARSHHSPLPTADTRPPRAVAPCILLILVAHQVVSPLLFGLGDLDPFEDLKLALLGATAIVGSAVMLSGRARMMSRAWLTAGLRQLWREPILLGALLLFASASISTTLSISPITSWQGFPMSQLGLGTMACYVALFLVTRAACQRPDDGKRLLAASVVAAAGCASYALVQWLHLDPLEWTGVPGFVRHDRPFSTLGHPNHLAAYLVMVLPSSLYFVHDRLRARDWYGVSALVPAALLTCLVVLVALSRGAWLALVAGVLVLQAGWCSASTRALARLAAIAMVSILLIGGLAAATQDNLLERLRRFADDAGRGEVWTTGMAIFAEHPWCGCGPDTFALEFCQHRTLGIWQREWNRTALRAHNEAIHILATQGVLGAAALLVFGAGLCIASWRAWKQAPDQTRPLLLAVLGGLAGYVVVSAFNFTVPGVGVLFVTLAAILSRLGGEQPAASVRGRERGLVLTLAVAAGIVVISLWMSLAGESAATGRAPLVVVLIAACMGLTVAGLSRRRAELAGAPRLETPRRAPARGLGWLVGFAPCGIWACAAWLLWLAVVRPLAASRACAAGERLLATDPVAAARSMESAAALDPSRGFYYVRWAAAADAAAAQAQGVEEREQWLSRAAEALQRAQALVPIDGHTHASLGRIRTKLAQHTRRVEDVFAAFDRALDCEPWNLAVHLDAGDAALFLGAHDRARAYAERAVALYPRFGPALGQLGYLALVERRYEDARKLLEAAHAGQWHGYEKALTAAWANLTATLWHLGQYEAANAVGQRTLQRAPDHGDIRHLCARSLELLGRRAEARAAYEAILEGSSDDRSARAAVRRLSAPRVGHTGLFDQAEAVSQQSADRLRFTAVDSDADGIEDFAPRPLRPAPAFAQLTAGALAPHPVSAAFWEQDAYLVCNYDVLQEVDVRTGAVVTLPAPPDAPGWNPTGLWADASQSLILLANYGGHDVLELQRSPAGLVLKQRYVHPEMRSPEGVALSPDGRFVAVADYDGSHLWLFRRDGSLAWSRPLGLAHGVAFGPDYVAVSGLANRRILKFDLEGNLLAETGGFGWSDGRFLYPTTLLAQGNFLYVADAHTGKISTLDHSLAMRGWSGGNGPGTGLFNMPYGLAGRPGELLVCDTFKQRLLVLDDALRCRRILNRAPQPLDWDRQPVGRSTWQASYVNLSADCAMTLPGRLDVMWRPGFGNYHLYAGSAARTAKFPRGGSLFMNDSDFPYFCWCLRARHEGHDYLLLGHSQGTLLLIVDSAWRCYWADVGQRLWAVDGVLRSDDGTRFDAAPHLRAAAHSFAEHERLLAAGVPALDALHQAYCPALSAADFERRVRKSFVSAAGLRFWEDWRRASTTEDRQRAAQTYDSALPQDDVFWLQEFFLRFMLVRPQEGLRTAS